MIQSIRSLYPSNETETLIDEAPINGVLKDVDYPHEILGLVTVTGKLEDFDLRPKLEEKFRDSPSLIQRARQVDAVIIYFGGDTTYPISTGSLQREYVGVDIAKAQALHETNILLKAFILGIERQLVRRVLAVGCLVTLEKTETTKWLPVPIETVDRYHPPLQTIPEDI